MAFQRSYSKVWWGSDNITNSATATFNFYEKIDNNNRNYTNTNNNNNISSAAGGGGDFYSLDSQHHIKYSGNLSRIQEVEENSKLWRSHDSPGSLKSQDSGFSDHDNSLPQSNISKSSSSSSSPTSKRDFDSEQSIRTIETPPTVIKRKVNNSNIISPILLHRRSFSAPNSPILEYKKNNNNNTSNCDLISQIDRISFMNSSTPNHNLNNNNINNNSLITSKLSLSDTKDRSIRRRRISGNRKIKRNIFSKIFIGDDIDDMSDKSIEFENYQNETIYLGGLRNDDDNNNIKKSSDNQYFNTYKSSTPIMIRNNFNSELNTCQTSANNQNLITLPYHYEYEHPLLNGHSISVQYWIDDIRKSYDHEVMSTLQTKSIAQEAFRNLKITTNTVAKIIRQLQIRSLELQCEFERCERILRSKTKKISLQDAILNSIDLIENVNEFVKIIERRSVFFTSEYRKDRKKFENNIEHIQLIAKDLKISLEKQHYLEFDSLYEDIQVMKHYILLTIRLVFEKLIRIIVLNVENSKSDLMLRANLNMIATLSNIDYNGFGSLTDAFIQNDTERILLLICLDNKLPSVRALTLRALATICSTTESIQQFCIAGGIDIIRDILYCDIDNNKKRSEPEKRETVSLLTQITAPWHGTEHKVTGFKDCIETIIEGITDIIVKTNCCQTLLLCAASLNNLSRLEMTSVYSIMSNETIIKLKEAVEKRGPGVSIFLYEQITTMLYNMSSNKKCHNHLANTNIINFITYIFQSQFYEKFQSRAESESHRKTIKMILHIYQRLIHESLVGQEILENNFIPIFTKIEQDLLNNYEIYGNNNVNNNNNSCCEYIKDISYLTKQLNESISNKSFNRSIDGRNSVIKLNLTRQESYV